MYREADKISLIYLLFVLGCASYDSYGESYASLTKRTNPPVSEDTIHKDNLALHKALGEKYYSDRKYHLAVTEFSTAVGMAPGDVIAYEGLGRSYREMGELNRAIETVEKGLMLMPPSPTSTIHSRLYNTKAVTYDMMGKHEEAIVEFEKAIKLDPTNDSYYNNKGFSYLLHGQVEEAIAEFKKALEINHDNKTAHANLGYAYGSKGMYELALNEFKLGGDESSAYNNLGHIYTKDGKLAEAIEAYNNALKINPNIPNTYYNKGKTYELLADIDNAIQAYQDFLKYTTETSVAEEVFQRIQALKRKKEQLTKTD